MDSECPSPGDFAPHPQPLEPTLVQIDPKCLHSAPKEFFDPVRTNDLRTDFFAVYRRESEEFDKDYAGKYDEDLNTSLIFAGLFSAVSSAFIIDVQSNLQSDPNEMTAAYLRILIHNMNNSLFPDADPSSVTWDGPPPEIVTVQSLLYGSLATSLFAAFIAMLGKQWVSRYLRKQGGSAAEKSRDRQQKLEGFKEWHFQLAIESLPVMLQFALLLLGCALTLYLWTISRTVAGVIMAFTLFGLTSYIFFTLVATLHYNCPYQTPPSILIRAVIRHLARTDPTFVHSPQSLTSPIPSLRSMHPVPYVPSVTPPSSTTSLPLAKQVGRLLGHILSGLRRALQDFHCRSIIEEGSEGIAQPFIVSPVRIFEDVSVNWEVCKADSRCIWWVLDYTADDDVLLPTARFAADTIWYPEIVGVVSPHVLADLFFDCLLNGDVIPAKLEHANAIGMALASVLSIRLVMEPESQALVGLCERIWTRIEPLHDNPACRLVAIVLRVATERVAFEQDIPVDHVSRVDCRMVSRLPTSTKLWLSRVVLQHFWWNNLKGPTVALSSDLFTFMDGGGMTDGDDTPVILKTNCFLAVAISLGLQVDSRDLYPPNTIEALVTAANLACRQLQTTIKQGDVSKSPDILEALSTLVRSNPFQVTRDENMGFTLIADILGSSFPEQDRYKMGRIVVELLGRFLDSEIGHTRMEPRWIPYLLDFLLLNEKFYATETPPYPGSTLLRIISTKAFDMNLGTEILPILSLVLRPIHPLQSRSLALEIFNRCLPGLFSPQMENIPAKNLKNLLQAVGDPFLVNLDTPSPRWQPLLPGSDPRPIRAAVILITLASSNLWRNHLHPSNFTTCEELLSTRESKSIAITYMIRATQTSLSGSEWFFSDLGRLQESRSYWTAAMVAAAVGRLEELQCLNTAEVVVMWAWTFGVLDVEDRDAWGLVERSTFLFYQTHGIGRLKHLEWHLANKISYHHDLLFEPYDTIPEPPRVYVQPLGPPGSFDPPDLLFGPHGNPLRRGTRLLLRAPPCSLDRDAYLDISQVCQLRRLYCLFGRDPTTREGAVAVEVGEETDLSLTTTSEPFMPWACDYP